MKYLLSILVLLTVSTFALAQEAPKAEVFGGYSYMRQDGGDFGGINMNGWNASFNYNLSNVLGLKADFSGHYKNDVFVTSINGRRVAGDTSDFTFLFGPQFTLRKYGKITPFAHTLFGGVRGKTKVSIPGTVISDTDTVFGAALGGGVDLKLSRNLAFRMIQADYLLTRSNGQTGNNLRISTGLVFHIGAK